MNPGTPTIERRSHTATGSEAPGVRLAELAGRFGPWLGGAVLPFVLVLYLALKGGGYDAAVRSEVGIAIWWVVLLGALAGILPMTRLSRAAWVALGLLAAFAAWAGLSMAWSESAGASFDEAARMIVYLGALALAISVQGPEGIRRMVSAVGAAIAVVALLALLSRLHPAWFPANEAAGLPNAQGRLNYPLNYWNALAALMAMGVFCLLAIAVGARHLVTRSLATAVLPVLSLTAFYTTSRAMIPIAAVGIALFLVVHPRRLRASATIALGALGSGLVIAAAAQRDTLAANIRDAVAAQQGDEMLAIVLIACAGVGLLAAALELADRHGVGPRISVSRRRGVQAAAIAGVLVTGALAAAIASGKAANAWESFKSPGSPGGGTERLESASGNGRYQYWSASIEQNASDPLKGTGAGTFELWWEQNADVAGAVKFAHSLYFETLGELGIVGLALLLGLVVWILFTLARRAWSAPDETRGLLAAVLATWLAFALAMSVDWGWQLAVMPVAALLVAGVALPPREDAAGDPAGRHRGTARIALGVLALVGLVVAANELIATRQFADSQAAARGGDLETALAEAQSAEEVQPWAADPVHQQALVLEQMGGLRAASALASEAVDAEPTNWEPRLTLARIEQQRGNRAAAEEIVVYAKNLYPSYLGFDTEPLPEETGVRYEP